MTTIQPRTAIVTIYQGDYLDRIRHLEQKYEAALEAEKDTTRTLDEIPESADLREQHTALVAEADKSALHITVKGLGRKQWRTLVAKHKPRPDHKSDEFAGVNEETFKDDLVPASILEPELILDDLDEISDVDFDRLYLTAFGLNRSLTSAPKALASPANQESDAT